DGQPRPALSGQLAGAGARIGARVGAGRVGGDPRPAAGGTVLRSGGGAGQRRRGGVWLAGGRAHTRRLVARVRSGGGRGAAPDTRGAAGVGGAERPRPPHTTLVSKLGKRKDATRASPWRAGRGRR